MRKAFLLLLNGAWTQGWGGYEHDRDQDSRRQQLEIEPAFRDPDRRNGGDRCRAAEENYAPVKRRQRALPSVASRYAAQPVARSTSPSSRSRSRSGRTAS